MSSEAPEDLYYTESHEYLRVDNSEGVVGLTRHAVTELNEIIYLELPDEGDEVRAGEPFGTVEAVKAVFDLNSPITGEVVAVNLDVADNPQAVVDDPYGEGWLIRVKIDDPTEIDALMDADAYMEHCESESH